MTAACEHGSPSVAIAIAIAIAVAVAVNRQTSA